jgi:hypothetical protein
MSMNFIQRVRFIHNKFSKMCRGERSNVDVKFQKQCCIEIRFSLDNENTKEKNRKGSDIFRDMDSSFQLGFRNGKV